MNDDPVLVELEETGRKIWEKGGGTVDGVFDYCHRTAQQALAEYAVYGNRWRGVGREPAKSAEAEGKAHAEGELLGCGAMVVCEGEVPNYQTVERSTGQTIKRSNGDSDLARKGEKGE
jgi:hypothetical protein